MGGFDLGKTSILLELLAQPAETRGPEWVERLMSNAADASMAVGDLPIRNGPDGLPYFWLHLPPQGQPFEAYSVGHVVPECTERGLGCVLEGVDGAPPWVFTYGNMWSFRSTGSFGVGQARPRQPPTGGVLVAAPSEELVPTWARNVLRSWLAHVGVPDPGVALVVDSGAEGGPVDWLAFSIFPDQFADEAAYQNVMSSLHWFLPPRFAALVTQRGTLDYTPL